MKLAVRKNDVDFLDIINMTLNRQSWGKKHILYVCRTAQVSCVMYQHNFLRGMSSFVLTVSDDTISGSDYGSSGNLHYWPSDTYYNFLRRVDEEIIKVVDSALREHCRNKAREQIKLPYYDVVEKVPEGIKEEFNYHKLIKLAEGRSSFLKEIDYELFKGSKQGLCSRA